MAEQALGEIKKNTKIIKTGNYGKLCHSWTRVTVFKWLAWFRSGPFNLEEQECPDRPAVVYDVQIEMLIKTNHCHTTRDTSEVLRIYPISDLTYLKTDTRIDAMFA